MSPTTFDDALDSLPRDRLARPSRIARSAADVAAVLGVLRDGYAASREFEAAVARGVDPRVAAAAAFKRLDGPRRGVSP
jgi:hypothetical protein